MKTIKISDEAHTALKAIQINEYARFTSIDKVIKDLIRKEYGEYLNENFKKYFKK